MADGPTVAPLSVSGLRCGLGSAVVFVAAEIVAAVQRRGQTATARVRALPKPLRWAVGLAALALGIWLGPHFALGWWG